MPESYLRRANETAGGETEAAMRCDGFFKTYNRDASKRGTAEIVVEVEETTDLNTIIAAFAAAGYCLTRSDTLSIYEVQTDLGIYSRNGKALHRRGGSLYEDVTFKSWEQLEAEDAA
jgi:hypothetical protein